MSRIIYFICLALLIGMVACTSSEKEENKNEAVQQSEPQDAGRKKLSLQTSPSGPTAPAKGIPTPELDDKSLDKFFDNEILIEVMEIAEIEKIKRKVNNNGDLVINWPSNENPRKRVEFTFSRGEVFQGSMDTIREMAEGASTIFFDDIGNLGGYYEGGENDVFKFPMGGLMYSFKIPDIFPQDLKAEKSHQLALRILEVNQ